MDNHVSFGNIVFGLASAQPTPQGLSGAPFPRFLFASLAKEQFYSTFSKYNFNFCIMTAVVPAVFHFLLSFKFGDYGLGRQLPPISSHILGVAHLCHAEKMEFLVAAINQ